MPQNFSDCKPHDFFRAEIFLFELLCWEHAQHHQDLRFLKAGRPSLQQL
jgi:hypothetical protein